MRVPRRLRRQAGRHALVDGIPFALPVDSRDSPALLAVFPVDPEPASRLLPGEIHPVVVFGRALLVICVIDYRSTDIGRYVEFSVALACTHGPQPLRTPFALLRHHRRIGQFVLDLPVSTEISVKGGKGIWGMPKHRASLDFRVEPRRVSSRYDLDGRLAVQVDVDRPRFDRLPFALPGVNYCVFRGMLMRSRVHVRGRAGVGFGRRRSARLTLGDQPRIAGLVTLGAHERPWFTAYFPTTAGVLDDHVESWFETFPEPPREAPEGLESVAGLGLGQDWPPPPQRSP